MQDEEKVSVSVSSEHADVCPSVEELEHLAFLVLTRESKSWSRVGVVLSDHRLVRSLNEEYLGHSYNTDVLSFSLEENAAVDGEVYVDVETAIERCEEFKVQPADEIRRYVIHGILHLVGYDDDTAEQMAEMKNLEDEYLQEFEKICDGAQGQ